MNAKVIVLTIAFVIVGAGLFLFLSQEEDRLTDAELRALFKCDRTTEEALATDVYCDNPEFYYIDLEDGDLIDEMDFFDPRYNARINGQVPPR